MARNILTFDTVAETMVAAATLMTQGIAFHGQPGPDGTYRLILTGY